VLCKWCSRSGRRVPLEEAERDSMSAGWAEGAVLGGGSKELGAIKVEKCNGDYLVQWNQGRKHEGES